VSGSPGSPHDRVLDRDHTSFPKRLLTLSKPPEVLYARGDISLLKQPIAAIVGSREPTNYGIRIAYQAAYEAARAGIVVVSGLARGLDARAHRGALDAGGRTIAVLGTGFDVAYPRANLDLLEAIPREGLLLTELPPGTRPTQWSFPARNRIIAALAECLLVVEGRIQGGTQNTVGWMLLQGRTVLAVPGRIDEEVAMGPNVLIREGATPYFCPGDLLKQFGLAWDGVDPSEVHGAGATPGKPAQRGLRRGPGPDQDVLDALSDLAAAEASVFDLVTQEPVAIDQIAGAIGLDHGTLLAALSALELKGLVDQLPGKRFRLAS
jgi:DNA processing protein